MLTDEEKRAIRAKVKEASGEWHFDLMMHANEIESAVLAKALAQQERLHKEWSELWSPIDEVVRPLTPLGGSVAAKAVELINTAKAMPKQEPIGDRAMLLKLMYAFDNEFFVCDECGHQETTSDMDSAYLLREYLQLNTQPAQAAAIPEAPSGEMISAGIDTMNRGRALFGENLSQIVSNIWEDMYAEAISASPKPDKS